MNFSVQIGKLKLQNPVMVASGTFGYGVEYAQLFDLNRLGAVVVKGIRPGPVRGNPTHPCSNVHLPDYGRIFNFTCDLIPLLF